MAALPLRDDFDAERCRAAARRVDEGPIPAAHGVVRWRIVDLARPGGSLACRRPRRSYSRRVILVRSMQIQIKIVC